MKLICITIAFALPSHARAGASSAFAPSPSRGAMGHNGENSKTDDSWSFYTAQAQSMGHRALNSTDEALRTARVQIDQLQDASSQQFAAAQKLADRAKQEYTHYEGLVFKKLKEGVNIAVQNPNATFGILGVTTLLALRTPRRLLYRYTIGQFRSEEAMLTRAETKVKEMHQTVDSLKNETKKLEERAKLAEEEFLRGMTKLKNSGSQISSLSRGAYKTESSARGLMDSLRDLPGREALRLRAEVASMASEVKQQRNLLDKRVSQIASYGISV